MRFALCLLVASLAAPALAAPRVVVSDLKGDRHNAATKPLRSALCAQLSCVEQKKVGLPRRLDWKKAGKARVKAVLTGKVARKKVILELRTNPGAPAKTWHFTVDRRGRIKPADIASVREELVSRFAPPPPPAPEPTPAPEPEPAAPPPPKLEPTPAPEARPEPKPEPKPVEPAREEPPRHEEEQGAPILHALLGLDLESRTLKYDNLTSANLSEYDAPAVWAPRLRLELDPLAHGDGPARGLGFALDYRFAVGLKSAVTGGPSHPTHMSVFSLDVRYRIDAADGKLGIIPFAGYRRAGFQVDPASDGSRFVGLPKIVTGGVRLGVGADLTPVEKLHLLAQLDYELVVAKAELIGPDYFPSGSASAYELDLGAGYFVAPHIDLRLMLEYTHTGFSFDQGKTTRYAASGASESLLGGRLMVGYAF